MERNNGWQLAKTTGDATLDGVQRQYSGTAGRIENSEVGVFLGYAGRHRRALVDRALYPRKEWVGDASRRWAERYRRGYVLDVTSGQRLGFRAVTTWIEDLPAEAWQRLSAGEGVKGLRLYGWACVPYRGGAEGLRCTLLVQRSVARPEELSVPAVVVVVPGIFLEPALLA